MNIFDKITAENIKVYWEADTNRPPYVGEAFFPRVKQKGLKFDMIKGKQGTPVALVSSNFGTNVLFRDRIGFNELTGKLPYFKEAYSIDEELRQDILSTKEEYATTLIDRVFDDITELVDGAEVTAERMRMQLLATGTIAIAENGVDKAYDYGFSSSAQLLTEGTKWNASGAKPVDSLLKQLKAYKKRTKKAPAYVLISDVAFDYLLNDADMLAYFKSTSPVNPYPTDAEKQSFLESRLAVRFVVTDKTYKKARDFGGDDVPFYLEDRYTILPEQAIGETVYGTTPEEADLVGKISKASSATMINEGVAVVTWNEIDPVTVNTKVAEVVAPTAPNIDLITIVKVL